MRGLRIYIVFLMMAVALSPLYSQGITTQVSIDSTQLLIGEQTMFRIEVSQDKSQTVAFPVLTDTLSRGIEILGALKPDTIVLSDDRIQINQSFVITCFVEGLYHINPLPFVAGTDTVYSNGLGLKVIMPFEIDTTDLRFFDIKPSMSPEFVWADYHPYLVLLLAILFAIFMGIHLYRLYKQRGLHIGKEEKRGPKLPPHVVAMAELEEIKQQKLWQNGKEKEYYTKVTDVLRVYLHDRFGVNAMESTSHEIIDEMKKLPEVKDVMENIKQVLDLADYVKFAKFKPISHENESSLMNALFFVEKTKFEEPKENPQPTESGENEHKTDI